MFLPRQQLKLARGADDKEQAMSQTAQSAISVIGIDICVYRKRHPAF